MITVEAESSVLLETIKLHVLYNNEEVGHNILIPHSFELYEIHTSAVSNIIKGHTIDIGKSVLLYTFHNLSRLQKLITKVPVNNRLARMLTKRCGFKLEGVITSSFLLDGKMIDQELYGIDRSTVCQLQL